MRELDSIVFNKNNFDLIRLFAATQVALHHAAVHLKVHHFSGLEYLLDALSLFPGVPVFFFISGFLISRSFEKNSALSNYAINRSLRLLPGLIACGLGTVFLVWFSGYLNGVSASNLELFTWVVGQVTVFQFYDPAFLNGFGIGQSNGSLWTIYIELQFYILIPILYAFSRKLDQRLISINRFVFLLAVLFCIFSQLTELIFSDVGKLFRLVNMTFAPYFYMFLVGVYFQRRFLFFYKLLAGKFLITLALYIALYFILGIWIEVKLGNAMNVLLYFVLCCVIFSAAFTARDLSRKLLSSNDISYGIYIYHMPIVNLFMYLGLQSSLPYYFAVLALIIFVAATSWFIIEKPAMKLKIRALHPVLGS